MADLAMPARAAAPPPARRTFAVGVIRRANGRTTRITATATRVAGIIHTAAAR